MPVDPYMDGLLASVAREEDVTCSSCGKQWEVEFYEELGGCWPKDDNDLICADCGAEAD